MAAVALNTFRTIRHALTTNHVGIYTAPIGVASIIVSAQITNVSNGNQTHTARFSHYRANDGLGEYDLIKDGAVPANDALLPLGARLVLETDDEVRISADQDGTLTIVMSILETAKG